MKAFRVVRVGAIVALVLFSLLGLTWRAGLSDNGLAAYQAQIKPPKVSVSIEQEGRIIKVEGVRAPGAGIRPCSATLVFDVESSQK